MGSRLVEIRNLLVERSTLRLGLGTSLARVALATAWLAGAGCTVTTGPGTGSGTPTGDGGPSSPGTGTPATGTPCPGQGIKVLGTCNAPKDTYVALEAPDRDTIANEMWTVMTNAQCWFKSGSTQQYVFYGQLEYTFWGATSDSKSFGTLVVESIGRFEDKNAAVVRIRGESWLIVTLDAQTLTLGKSLNGQPYVELYKAHNEGRCL